jgi:hypothetical protein
MNVPALDDRQFANIVPIELKFVSHRTLRTYGFPGHILPAVVGWSSIRQSDGRTSRASEKDGGKGARSRVQSMLGDGL